MGLPPLLCRSISNPLSDLAPPPPPPLLPHPSCSTRLQSLLLRVFPRSNHVSFLPSTFPRPLPAVLSPAAVYAPCETKWERHPPLHLHRGISIYLLVFNSRLDIQRDVRHFETWIRNLNYAMPRSTIPRLEARLFRDSPKENFISSPIFSRTIEIVRSIS